MFKSLFFFTVLNFTTPDTHNQWNLWEGKYWQKESHNPLPRPQDLSGGICPSNMIRVHGNMKLDPSTNLFSSQTIEALQKTTCTKWINKGYPERCAEFDREKWLNISSSMQTQPMNFCMDQFEFPNEKGQYPVIFIDFHDAGQVCKSLGKRLCSETEWTFACEGEEATPYPTGYLRPVNECNIDKPWRLYHASALSPRSQAFVELDRLWQGNVSGEHSQCKSSFGVYDMIGSVDEWTTAVYPNKFKSILAGGYWGPVRTRCRPKTRSHNENHTFYQQGFRCCSDIK